MAELLTPERLIFFLFFVVPGFVTIRVYDLLVPTERRNVGESFVDLIAYSFLILVFWSVPYLGLVSNSEVFAPWLYYVLLVIAILMIVVVSPVLVAYGYYRLRTSDFLLSKVPHPSPTAWDFFFEQDKFFWVRFHLDSDEKLGAYYGANSFATSYPNVQQVYVEELYRLEEDGTISTKVEATMGAIINREDCYMVEFLEVEEAAEEGS